MAAILSRLQCVNSAYDTSIDKSADVTGDWATHIREVLCQKQAWETGTSDYIP